MRAFGLFLADMLARTRPGGHAEARQALAGILAECLRDKPLERPGFKALAARLAAVEKVRPASDAACLLPAWGLAMRSHCAIQRPNASGSLSVACMAHRALVRTETESEARRRRRILGAATVILGYEGHIQLISVNASDLYVVMHMLRHCSMCMSPALLSLAVQRVSVEGKLRLYSLHPRLAGA